MTGPRSTPGPQPDGCSVAGCRDTATTRGLCEAHYRRKIRMRIYGYRDVGPLRDHVAALRRLGWTWQGIADAAGLSNNVAYHIHRGTTASVWPESATRLLAVPLTPYNSQRGADSAGTRRRVQALAWMGWPCAEVAARAGVTTATLRTLILPSRRVSYRLAARVAAVYDELSMTDGPSQVAARRARQLGFLPPLAWDDDLIDLPDADLEAELARRVELMDDADLRRCHTAYYGHGERSPLIAAGAKAWRRRLDARRNPAA